MINTDIKYNDFLELVTQQVSERTGEGYSVKCNRVRKNNSLEFDCLCIRKEDAQVAPSIYMSDFYNGYLEGTPLEKVVDAVMDMYYANCDSVDVGRLNDFTLESMRDCIIFRLVNYELNEELLETVPYLRYKDMAVTFHCLINLENHGMGTVRITSEHAEVWGLTPRQLFEIASDNMPKLLPCSFSNIVTTLADMLVARLDREDSSKSAEDKENPEDKTAAHPIADSHDKNEINEMLECLDKCAEADSDRIMYVLTTTSGISGAACILYPGVPEMIAEKIGDGYYILPSSVHELIIVADSASSRADLEAMVRSVNSENVPPEDILSYSVYHYPEDDFCVL